jgi:hypothetical protein
VHGVDFQVVINDKICGATFGDIVQKRDPKMKLYTVRVYYFILIFFVVKFNIFLKTFLINIRTSSGESWLLFKRYNEFRTLDEEVIGRFLHFLNLIQKINREEF